MPWPNDDLDTTEFEDATRSPAAARPMLLRLIQRVREIIAARASVNGIAPLDQNICVPVVNLPAATTAAGGVVQLATVAEAVAGADAGKAVTPAGINGIVRSVSITRTVVGSGNVVSDVVITQSVDDAGMLTIELTVSRTNISRSSGSQNWQNTQNTQRSGSDGGHR